MYVTISVKLSIGSKFARPEISFIQLNYKHRIGKIIGNEVAAQKKSMPYRTPVAFEIYISYSITSFIICIMRC